MRAECHAPTGEPTDRWYRRVMKPVRCNRFQKSCVPTQTQGASHDAKAVDCACSLFLRIASSEPALPSQRKRGILMGTERVDVVIVGAGQAGLALSYYLTAQ